METATPTSRRASADQKRDILCAELITLRALGPAAGHRGGPRSRHVEARLKQIADECGASFKVTLSNGDYVQVSPPVAAEFKGNVPALQTEIW
jgi:hypothetical protein